MDLRDFVGTLRLHRWLVLTSVLAALAVAGALTFIATPQYRATTRLFVSTSAADEAIAIQGGQFSIQRVQSYADLLNGDEISRRVVDRLNLDESPRDLTKQIDASAGLDTVILVINVTDPSPERAKVLANAVAREFVSFVGELETPPGKRSATVKATVVDAASTPITPVSPKPVLNLTLGLVLGTLLGAGLALVKNSLDSNIRSPKALEEASGAPLLGTIAFDRRAREQPLISSLDPYSPRVEAFRFLRTNLEFIDPDRDHKVFVVTSSIPGEGKTTTATNLALILAEGGKSVALVEGDLRRPRVSEYVGLESSVGLTTVIVGQVALEDALQTLGDLTVLTSGRVPPNPAELLQTDSMRTILRRLRQEFDFVIVDAPPLLPVTDASVLATEADGAILIARHGKTTKDQVATAASRITQVHGRVIGVILNMTPKRGGGPDGAYGYGYGYGYGYAPKADERVSPEALAESRDRLHRAKPKDSDASGDANDTV